MTAPTINFASVTLDCPNQEALADFYTALLGWKKSGLMKNGLPLSLRIITYVCCFKR